MAKSVMKMKGTRYPSASKEDGRVMRPYYLLQVKKPSESKYPFDYLKLLATVPAEQAARPLSESACPMVKHR
jgi:branched-chain amino acid transport system substrate-binding protein